LQRIYLYGTGVVAAEIARLRASLPRLIVIR
jgi:hypothetical protein